MFDCINEYIAHCGKKILFTSSVRLFLSRLSSVAFIMHTACVWYFLVYDTSYIVNIGLYSSEAVAAVICAFAVFIDVILFLAANWYNFSAEKIIWQNFSDSDLIKTDLLFTVRLVGLRIVVFVAKKLTSLFIWVPFIVSLIVFYCKIETGIDIKSLYVIFAGVVFLFLVCLLTVVKFNNRFFLAEFYTNLGYSLIESLKYSICSMDGYNKKLNRYKRKNIIYHFMGVFIPYFSVVAYAREFVFVTDKTIEYALKKHTQQKSIVFYCK